MFCASFPRRNLCSGEPHRKEQGQGRNDPLTGELLQVHPWRRNSDIRRGDNSAGGLSDIQLSLFYFTDQEFVCSGPFHFLQKEEGISAGDKQKVTFRQSAVDHFIGSRRNFQLDRDQPILDKVSISAWIISPLFSTRAAVGI